MRFLSGAAALALAVSFAVPALAQLPTVGGYKDAANAPQLGIGVGVFGLDSGTGLRCAVGSTSTCQVPTNGTFTGSVTGFRPTLYGTPIVATTGGVTGTLPAGAQVVAFNTDTTNTAFCALGASSSTSAVPLSPNGGWFNFAINGDTQLTCITAAGTAKVNMAGGSGLPTGTGGGSSGSGGSNASVGANSSASPTSSTLTGYQNGSGNTVQDSSTSPHPVADAALLAAAQSGVGTNGSAAPSTSIQVGGKTSGSTIVPLLVTSAGLAETQDTGTASNNSAFQGAVAMTVGTTYTVQRAVGANCTVAGNVTVTLADASTVSWPVAVGWNREAFGAAGIASSGTTATCTYSNLK